MENNEEVKLAQFLRAERLRARRLKKYKAACSNLIAAEGQERRARRRAARWSRKMVYLERYLSKS